MIYQRAGKRMRFLRKEQGLTQIQLAEIFRVTQKYISEVENGHKQAPLVFFAEVASYFDVTVDGLINPDPCSSVYVEMITNIVRKQQPADQAYILGQIRLFVRWRKAR